MGRKLPRSFVRRVRITDFTIHERSGMAGRRFRVNVMLEQPYEAAPRRVSPPASLSYRFAESAWAPDESAAPPAPFAAESVGAAPAAGAALGRSAGSSTRKMAGQSFPVR